MQPKHMLKVCGEVCLGYSSNIWHSGFLVFYKICYSDSITTKYVVEVFYNVKSHRPEYSCEFEAGQLIKVPPRQTVGMFRRYIFFQVQAEKMIKFRAHMSQMNEVVELLNSVKATGTGTTRNFQNSGRNHGDSPYPMSYSQQVFAARRASEIHRPSPVLKSPSGRHIPSSPKRYRLPRDRHDSNDYTLQIIREDPNTSGVPSSSFFRSTHDRRNFGEERSPLKSLNSNSNHDHSKRPRQLNFDSGVKRPRLSYDYSQESGPQLGGKQRDSHTPRKITEGDTFGSSEGTSSPFTGFPNIGNSCFMNSVLQSLMQLRCVAEDMEHVRHSLEQKLPEQSIIRYLLSLLSCPPEDCQMLLGQTLEVVCNSSPCFADGQQHDALEFLVQLLDIIKEEVKKASKAAMQDPVANNIEFQIHSSYMCQKCQKVISTKELLHMLSLNVPNSESGEILSITDALKNYFEPQEIEMKCEHCSGTSTKCFQAFSTFPRLLIFHLKRYTYVDGTCKIVCPVHVPIHLSLEDFVLDPSLSKPSEDVKGNSTLQSSVSTNGPVMEKVISTSPTIKPVSSCELSTQNEKKTPSPTLPRTPVKINTMKFSNMSGRKVLNSLNVSNPNVPIVLKGGSDSANNASPIPALGSDVPQEKIEDTIMETVPEETEEEQIEKVLKLSRESAQCQEDKELIEAMNRSVQDAGMSAPYLDKFAQADPLPSIKEHDDTENISGPLSYRLASVVSHIGHNADTGHYVADLYEPQCDRWWHFNDEVVHHKSKHSVLESIKTQGYLFFYVARGGSPD